MFVKLVFVCACKYNGSTCKLQVLLNWPLDDRIITSASIKKRIKFFSFTCACVRVMPCENRINIRMQQKHKVIYYDWPIKLLMPASLMWEVVPTILAQKYIRRRNLQAAQTLYEPLEFHVYKRMYRNKQNAFLLKMFSEAIRNINYFPCFPCIHVVFVTVCSLLEPFRSCFGEF